MKGQVTILAIAGLLLTTGVSAQSAEEQVEQGVMSFYQALNDGDARAWASHNAAQYHGNFARTGFVLGTNAPIVENMQGTFDSGDLSYNLVVHNLDVTAYGNSAIATFYTTGPSNLANGTVITGTYRVTQVWVRDGGSWKVGHFHISPLVS